MAEKNFGETKTVTLSIFQKIFWVCLFPTKFFWFSQKSCNFWAKCRISMGNRQTQIFFKKMKTLNLGDVFSSPKCYNISKIENFKISQSWVVKIFWCHFYHFLSNFNAFLYFFAYCVEKHAESRRYCFNIDIKDFGDEKNSDFVWFPKKILTLSVSQEISTYFVRLVCLLRKIQKFHGKQTKSKIFLEIRQSECFFITKMFYIDIRPIATTFCMFFHTLCKKTRKCIEFA